MKKNQKRGFEKKRVNISVDKKKYEELKETLPEINFSVEFNKIIARLYDQYCLSEAKN